VAVEKLVFCPNGLKSGDRKCLPNPRKSLVGLLALRIFSEFSLDEFFNSHSPMHSMTRDEYR
jgi:hypothetical protein